MSARIEADVGQPAPCAHGPVLDGVMLVVSMTPASTSFGLSRASGWKARPTCGTDFGTLVPDRRSLAWQAPHPNSHATSPSPGPAPSGRDFALKDSRAQKRAFS